MQGTEAEKVVEPETRMFAKLFTKASYDNDRGWGGEAAMFPMNVEE